VLTIADRRPAHALVDAAAEADLRALGSSSTQRRLGLGSVSEHVAHHARCSMLVVRDGRIAADPSDVEQAQRTEHPPDTERDA
jgi:Universal stress protein family